MGVWAKVPRIATELNRWIKADRRWKRKALSRLSLETCLMRLPMSLTNLSPALFIGPMVYTATGMNLQVWTLNLTTVTHSLYYNLPNSCPSTPLDNIRVMMIVWRLRGNIMRTALCWIVWHNVHSLQYTYVSISYRFNRLGLSHWGTNAVHIEAVAYSCIIVTWWSGSGGIQAWSRRQPGFLQCFDTVGLVIWPVKIVPEMTYYIYVEWSETLNHTHSLTSQLATKTYSTHSALLHHMPSSNTHTPLLDWMEQLADSTLYRMR